MKKIKDTSKTYPLVDAEKIAKALGAEIVNRKEQMNNKLWLLFRGNDYQAPLDYSGENEKWMSYDLCGIYVNKDNAIAALNDAMKISGNEKWDQIYGDDPNWSFVGYQIIVFKSSIKMTTPGLPGDSDIATETLTIEEWEINDYFAEQTR